MTKTKVKENIGKGVFATAAAICIIAVVAIFVFLIAKSAPAFKKLGFFDFLFGKEWMPDANDKYGTANVSGSYGIFTMVVGTLAATVGALLIGGVFGFFTAVFLAFFCPKKLKRIFSSVINLLAGIPSVVYGFFGIAFLLPKLALFAPNNGSGLLAVSIILGIMILPTVVSLSRTSLEAVPTSYYEGAVAMGATHAQAVFKVVVPAAKSGIIASLVLGIGRALGETMAVVMVAGNSPTYPSGLFGSFRVLTANIVMEMGYAGELQEGALVASGVILLLFVLAINLLFNAISRRAVKTAVKPKNKEKKKLFGGLTGKFSLVKVRIKEIFGKIGYRLRLPYVGKGFALFCGGMAGLALVLVIGFIFSKGFVFLVKNPKLLYGKYKFGGSEITLLPSIVSTLMAVALSLIIAVPVGIMTAIFLNEYAGQGNVFVRIVRMAIDVLSGVPSIVYGLFGYLIFVQVFSNGAYTIWAGSVTISMMLLPTIVRSTEESLKSVALSLREGSFALGAGKMRTIFKVVLPSAMPGILSAVILSMGRVISESAPFMYTMGSVLSGMPEGYGDSGSTLAVALYRLSGEGWYLNEAYATAVVLIVLVLGLNILAEVIAGKLSKKLTGDKSKR